MKTWKIGTSHILVYYVLIIIPDSLDCFPRYWSHPTTIQCKIKFLTHFQYFRPISPYAHYSTYLSLRMEPWTLGMPRERAM